MEQPQLIPATSLSPELAEAQVLNHKQALANLISGKTPFDAICKRIVSKDLPPVSYVTGNWVIGQLNALFGYFWDFEIIAETVGIDQCWVKGKLTIKSQSGQTIIKTAYGGSRLKSKGNIAIDVGDDLKTAATDALKKCASLLGIASDVYSGTDEKVPTASGVDISKFKILYSVGEAKGLTEEQIDKMLLDKTGKEKTDVPQKDILAMLRDLRTLPDKANS